MKSIADLLEPYQKAFDSLVEVSANCVKEAILDTEKDLCRKLTKKEYDACVKFGAVVCVCKLLSYVEKK